MVMIMVSSSTAVCRFLASIAITPGAGVAMTSVPMGRTVMRFCIRARPVDGYGCVGMIPPQ